MNFLKRFIKPTLVVLPTILCIVSTTICVYYHMHENKYLNNEVANYTRDTYVARLESKYLAAQENLAIEVDKYIKTIAPNSMLNSLTLIKMCSKYNVDIRLVLAQGHIESHFGTKGTAARTNSVFNVGAFDGHSADMQIKNGYGYKHPDYSIEPYLKLITTRYLINEKLEEDLLEEFVDMNGKRYATNEAYESMLRDTWNKMDDIANISEAYTLYKMYKTQIGI